MVTLLFDIMFSIEFYFGATFRVPSLNKEIIIISLRVLPCVRACVRLFVCACVPACLRTGGWTTDLKIRLDSATYCFRPMIFEARENLRRPYW